MSRKILVVAAHSDDEVLGCGGTIARHHSEGDDVYVIFIADGVSSRVNSNEEDSRKRIEAADKAKKILGIKQCFKLDFPDNRLDSIPLLELVNRLELIIFELQPSIIYTHHSGDLNVDHKITHQAVLTACRPMSGSSIKAIYAFEIMSSTDWAAPFVSTFIPNHYVDISKQIKSKIDALRAYGMEMRPPPHSRSIEHLTLLAHHRGYTVGMHAAEAFMTIMTKC